MVTFRQGLLMSIIKHIGVNGSVSDSILRGIIAHPNPMPSLSTPTWPGNENHLRVRVRTATHPHLAVPSTPTSRPGNDNHPQSILALGSYLNTRRLYGASLWSAHNCIDRLV
mmetsp:Transcript_12041/g.19459  ORF Transcript_12041/g.19459 Transcript_12041/m.19459 type:complete len:112 (-) Transcript_12041:49-384(-)